MLFVCPFELLKEQQSNTIAIIVLFLILTSLV